MRALEGSERYRLISTVDSLVPYFSGCRAPFTRGRNRRRDALRAGLEAKAVPVHEGSWGYPLLVVDDPDGNQSFFNYPAETAS